MLWAEQPSSSAKDLGVLGDKKLTIHQQYDVTMKKANSIPGSIRKTIAACQGK